MRRPLVLLTTPIHHNGERMLADVADIIVAPSPDGVGLKSVVGDADFMVVRNPLLGDVLEGARRLCGIVRHGAGLDMIPMEAATALSIPVANVPGANSQAVAEYVIAAMLNFARGVAKIDADMRQPGGWNTSKRHTVAATELSGATIGIVGLGEIGSRVAKICHSGFGMRVLGSHPHAVPDFVESASLDVLFSESDYITLNCPLNATTKGLASARLISMMKPSAVIINAARGPVVDNEALYEALRSRRIGGAAIDVFDEEPIDEDNPFRVLDNVLLTPHVSALSQQSQVAMSEGAARQVLQMIRGERPTHLVNPEIWPTRRRPQFSAPKV